MNQAVRIFLVDDHVLVRSGISSYFDDTDQFQIVGEASNGAEALEWLEAHPQGADLLFTDLNMPVMDGFELVPILRKRFPAIKVVALSMLDTYQPISKMFAAGVHGYVLKSCEEEEIHEAVETVLADEVYQSPAIQQVILDYVTRTSSFARGMDKRMTVEVELTQREKEVLRLVALEYSNDEIAEKLFISKRTVDSHKRNLIEKTGARNSVGLLRYALNKGLVE